MAEALPRVAWIAKLETGVRRYLDGESSGHDPWHAFRVRDLAIRIAQSMERIPKWYRLPLCYMTSATCPVERSMPSGERASRSIFSRAPAFQRKRRLREVLHRATRLAARPGRRSAEVLRLSIRRSPMRTAWMRSAQSESPERSLSAARTAVQSGIRNRNGGPWGLTRVCSIHHFYDKLLRLPDDMYTEPGRCVASKTGCGYLEEFLQGVQSSVGRERRRGHCARHGDSADHWAPSRSDR